MRLGTLVSCRVCGTKLRVQLLLEMPYRKRARFTMQNLSDDKLVYYQINYTVTDVPDGRAAQFRCRPLLYRGTRRSTARARSTWYDWRGA
jgi:hypothetical protein